MDIFEVGTLKRVKASQKSTDDESKPYMDVKKQKNINQMNQT